MIWLKDIKYDDGGWTEGDDNDKDKRKDEDKDKDKDNDEMTKRPNMCHIFENDMIYDKDIKYDDGVLSTDATMPVGTKSQKKANTFLQGSPEQKVDHGHARDVIHFLFMYSYNVSVLPGVTLAVNNHGNLYIANMTSALPHNGIPLHTYHICIWVSFCRTGTMPVKRPCQWVSE